MLNKIKTSPYASIVWLLFSCVVHIVLFKSKVNVDNQIWHRILTMMIALCLTFSMHELLHYVVMKMFGKGNVKIKIMKSPIGLPTLGTVAQGEFQKWQLVIIYLAPFVVLTLLLDVIFLFCTKVEFIVFIVSLSNCAGAFYDIVESLIVIKRSS